MVFRVNIIDYQNKTPTPKLISSEVNTILMEKSEEMFQKVLDASEIRGAITCAEATALCRIYQFDMVAFREFCDKTGIKFKKCQFGCFE